MSDMILHAESDILQTYVKKIKVATAMAIIKMTPTGMTPEALAATLGEQALQYSNNNWTLKSPVAKQLLQNMNVSLFQEQKLDSGEGQIGDTSMSGNDCRSVVSSSEEFLKYSDCAVIPSHFVGFMNDILYLTKAATMKSSLFNETNSLTPILESVSRIFSYLKSPGGLMLPISVVESSIKTVHSLYSISDFIHSHLTQVCNLFVESLIYDILDISEINMFNKQHRHSSLIQMIGQHSSLIIQVLTKLMKEIIVFHKHAQNVKMSQKFKLHPVVAMENMYFIFQTINGVIFHVLKSESNIVCSLQLPDEILAEWWMMILDITKQPHLNLTIFYTCLFEIHSVIASAFKICDSLVNT